MHGELRYQSIDRPYWVTFRRYLRLELPQLPSRLLQFLPFANKFSGFVRGKGRHDQYSSWILVNKHPDVPSDPDVIDDTSSLVHNPSTFSRFLVPPSPHARRSFCCCSGNRFVIAPLRCFLSLNITFPSLPLSPSLNQSEATKLPSLLAVYNVNYHLLFDT
jgi:hypothetical protein